MTKSIEISPESSAEAHEGLREAEGDYPAQQAGNRIDNKLYLV